MNKKIKIWAKRLLFPGLDFHTRCRYRWVPPFFSGGPVVTLDVGFGNCAFSFAAAQKGNLVTSVSMDQKQVDNPQVPFSLLVVARKPKPAGA